MIHINPLLFIFKDWFLQNKTLLEYDDYVYIFKYYA